MSNQLIPEATFRHESGHCLQCVAGTMLNHVGIDPLHALGAGWRFTHRWGQVRREEYFLPGAGDDLFAALAPFHHVSSVWHEPVDAQHGWQQVRDLIATGQWVAVAADNYYLPFRPAYQDVHTNHLLVVCSADDAEGSVTVIDTVPPSFCGAISVETLIAARDSGNPAIHGRDLFFTANPINNRWLSLTVGENQPDFDAEFIRHAISVNLDHWAALPTPGDQLQGRAGLDNFLRRAASDISRNREVVDEVFLVLGPLLANTGLHSDFLRAAATRVHDGRLAHAARRVDRVAHHLAALRIHAATAVGDPTATESLLRRTTMLGDDLDLALSALESIISRT